MAHTNRPAAFASSLAITPEELGVSERSRAVWRAITTDEPLMTRLTRSPHRHIVYRLRRTDHRSDPLEALATLIVVLAASGATEAQARSIVVFLEQLVLTCWSGNMHRELDALDLEEQRCEQREDALTLELRILGESPERLEEAADSDEREAVISLERARQRRRRAHQLRSGMRSIDARIPAARVS